MKIVLSRVDTPLGAALTCMKAGLQLEWGNETKVTVSESLSLTASHAISRHVARLNPSLGLYPSHILHRTEVDHWLSVASGPLACGGKTNGILTQLDSALAAATFLTAKHLTIADLEVFGALYKSSEWNSLMTTDRAPAHVKRWFLSIQSMVNAEIAAIPEDVRVMLKNASISNKTSASDGVVAGRQKREEGKFVDLPGAKEGEVVVRFPPEASGYLHIGHAKAALLNQYYQQTFKGKLIMRFDDTNPAKENMEFENVILEDLKLLEIKPDVFTHTSDNFDTMLLKCEQLIQNGLAYVDDTDAETMKKEREEKKESKNRNNSLDKNMRMWQEMKVGTDHGQSCAVRAKIDMASPNGCLRDPTIYRCKIEPHVRTGTRYKVYPTYDFACPIVDSLEGVTHALRTTEYHDRDEQYYWFIEKLELRKPHIYEYSRLNMNNTVLSKRKLAWFVDEGLVDGWDDPRFPTVCGILRKGLTVEGLKDFIIAQGSSRSVVNMEWDKIWAFNKKFIDRTAPRYTALQGKLLPVTVSGAKEEPIKANKHPKDDSLGTKTVWISQLVYIEAVDAEELREGENATFINWGNILINKIHRKNGSVESVDAELNLSNTDYKKTLKVTWLADTKNISLTPVVCVVFDNLINKGVVGKDEDFKDYIGHQTCFEVRMVGDDDLKQLKVGDIIQLQRKGFFRVDEAYQPISPSSCREAPVVLFYIPDGHSKEMPLGIAARKYSEMSDKEKIRSAKGKNAEKSPQEEVKTLPLTGEKLPVISLHAGRHDKEVLLAMHNKIKEQGDKIRKMKSEKIDKNQVMAEVDILKTLKNDFNKLSGVEWKPDINITEVLLSYQASESLSSVSEGKDSLVDLHDRITEQGNKARKMKASKADPTEVKKEVEVLLSLKNDFKHAAGVDWKPDIDLSKVSGTSNTAAASVNVADLNGKIKKQGDTVRNLKNAQADKSLIKAEVDVLLMLKTQFKELTGTDWKPDVGVPQYERLSGLKSGKAEDARILDLHNQIKKQGDKIRSLKSSKAAKDTVKAEVEVLLSLKKEFQCLTNIDWKPDINTDQYVASFSGCVPVSEVSLGTPKGGTQDNPRDKSPNINPKAEEGAVKKQTRLGLEAKKEENLAEWYSQVITKAEMIEYYSVSGCYILRPWSYSIWEFIQRFFDTEIKKLGVENAYFPMFVSKDALEKEKTHIADFSPEVAWVTKSGSTDLAEPIAIRPTSETVMYPAFAKWVQSHRDLPVRLNQWNNVVRWEFKQPTPFLRTREFLWQEGHSAFATKEEAIEEVYQILDLYARVYEELLAIPVVKGKKTEKEKFAGGDFTTTTEAYISASGRGIQGATSHHLGQNFSRMFDVSFEDPKTQQREFAYQNSWGLTTRTIGVMIMVHGDNKGLVLPPRVASIQVIIMPVGITAKSTETDKENLVQNCKQLEAELVAGGIRVRSDLRENVTPAWKFNHWELKGVPLRIELGPREVSTGQVFVVRRDNNEKLALDRIGVVEKVTDLLEAFHSSLFQRAYSELESHVVTSIDWPEFVSSLESGKLIMAPFCGMEECEDNIKKDSASDESTEPGAPSMGAKSLCIPFRQPSSVTGLKCIHPDCSLASNFYALFGRSY